MPTRPEWQQLAEDRLVDAHTLLTASTPRWSATYYLSGYAVKCGLKSCVLVLLAAKPEVVFRDKKLSTDCWTHDIDTLLKAAELLADSRAEAATNMVFKNYAGIVRDWNENSRYEQIARHRAEVMFEAVTNSNHGVMKWIKARWWERRLMRVRNSFAVSSSTLRLKRLIG
jgi:hypothetical protein